MNFLTKILNSKDDDNEDVSFLSSLSGGRGNDTSREYDTDDAENGAAAGRSQMDLELQSLTDDEYDGGSSSRKNKRRKQKRRRGGGGKYHQRQLSHYGNIAIFGSLICVILFFLYHYHKAKDIGRAESSSSISTMMAEGGEGELSSSQEGIEQDVPPDDMALALEIQGEHDDDDYVDEILPKGIDYDYNYTDKTDDDDAAAVKDEINQLQADNINKEINYVPPDQMEVLFEDKDEVQIEMEKENQSTKNSDYPYQTNIDNVKAHNTYGYDTTTTTSDGTTGTNTDDGTKKTTTSMTTAQSSEATDSTTISNSDINDDTAAATTDAKTTSSSTSSSSFVLEELDINDVTNYCMDSSKSSDECKKYCMNPLQPKEYRSIMQDGVNNNEDDDDKAYTSWRKGHDANFGLVSKHINNSAQTDIVFLGDDILSGWITHDTKLKSYKMLFDSDTSKYKGLLLGTSSFDTTDTDDNNVKETTSNLLWKIKNMPQMYKINPKVWWVVIGTNDFNYNDNGYHCSSDLVTLGVKRIIHELISVRNEQVKNNKTDNKFLPYIVINSILPRSEPNLEGKFVSSSDNDDKDNNNKPNLYEGIVKANNDIRHYITETFSKKDHIEFFDATDIFLHYKTTSMSKDLSNIYIPKALMDDYVHPTSKGYMSLGQQIFIETETLIDTQLLEDGGDTDEWFIDVGLSQEEDMTKHEIGILDSDNNDKEKEEEEENMFDVGANTVTTGSTTSSNIKDKGENNCELGEEWDETVKKCVSVCGTGTVFDPMSKKCIIPAVEEEEDISASTNEETEAEEKEQDKCESGEEWDETVKKCVSVCGTGTVFDATTKKCIIPAVVVEEEEDISASTNEDTEAEETEQDKCELGEEWDETVKKCVSVCGTGTVFDATTYKCIIPATAGTSSSSTDSNSNMADTSNEEVEEKDGYNCDVGEEYDLSLKKCVSVCGAGTVFEPMSKKCVAAGKTKEESVEEDTTENEKDATTECDFGEEYDLTLKKCVSVCGSGTKFDATHLRCIPENEIGN